MLYRESKYFWLAIITRDIHYINTIRGMVKIEGFIELVILGRYIIAVYLLANKVKYFNAYCADISIPKVSFDSKTTIIRVREQTYVI